MNTNPKSLFIWSLRCCLSIVCFSFGVGSISADDNLASEVSPSHELTEIAHHTSAALLPSKVFGEPNCSPTESFWDRPHFLVDLDCFREEAAESGVTFDFSATQFYQGIATGGVDQRFRYSGRNDFILNVDGGKAGLSKGSFITLHAEARYSNGINADTGALVPANSAILYPAADGSEAALTGVKFTQALSENFAVFGGKINTLDELQQQYAAGRGVDAFMNLGLVFPMTAARTIPYSTLGAGFAVLDNMYPVFSFMILDTNDTSTTTGFESFFDNGATLLAKLDIPVTIHGRPGHQGIWGSYSSGTYNDLQPTAYFDPSAGPIVSFGTSTGSWALFYSADQALYVDPCNPQRSWGLFTNLGLADNGPSPVRWSANVGIGGSSPLTSRPLDTFGIGYSYVNFSEPVENLAPDLLPIQSDQAVELFYNIAVTKWLRVTPDIQVLIPARERTLSMPVTESIDTALLFGLRAKMSF